MKVLELGRRVGHVHAGDAHRRGLEPVERALGHRGHELGAEAAQLNSGKVLFHQGELPKDATLVTFCQSGLRNVVAAQSLRRAGFEVIVHLPACRAIASETAETACIAMVEHGITLAASLEQLDSALAKENLR